MIDVEAKIEGGSGKSFNETHIMHMVHFFLMFLNILVVESISLRFYYINDYINNKVIKLHKFHNRPFCSSLRHLER
jgi:hypothetical protein